MMRRETIVVCILEVYWVKVGVSVSVCFVFVFVLRWCGCVVVGCL
jgi:hypothetical protein